MHTQDNFLFDRTFYLKLSFSRRENKQFSGSLENFRITYRFVSPTLPLVELSPHEIPPVELSPQHYHLYNCHPNYDTTFKIFVIRFG